MNDELNFSINIGADDHGQPIRVIGKLLCRMAWPGLTSFILFEMPDKTKQVYHQSLAKPVES